MGCGCQPGKILASDGMCSSCPPGTFAEGVGESECTPCSPGFFQPAVGQAECLRCVEGEYSEEAGSVECLPCEDRLSAFEGSSQCDVCARGFYRRSAELAASAVSCQSCLVVESLEGSF